MKISIITAAYNSARTLEDTMRSVLAQSHADWEHIVIDGGSTDGTVELLQRMQPLYGGRLRWVSEPDRGIYDAMNKGIAMATGQVVGMLNSDDFYSSPEILSRVAEALADERLDAVYGDIHYVDAADLSRTLRQYSCAGFSRGRMLMGFQPAHPSFYCRRAVYERLGGFDLGFKVAADFEHMFRLIYVNRIRTRYLPLDFVTMRSGGASGAGMGSHKQIVIDHMRTYRKHGAYAGYAMDFMRYPFKVLDLLRARF